MKCTKCEFYSKSEMYGNGCTFMDNFKPCEQVRKYKQRKLQTNTKSVTDMKWHKPTELPKDGQVVLAKVKGLEFLEYAVVEYMSDYWWRYAEYWTPGTGKVEGWCGCELEIIEWTEIN